ncbi:hypothetical protein QBC39DRAFT_266948 [Podospora conica]|nr:hypothetical protein QBC39DRAFT_266948 [Schizothecium conicum]
MAQTTSSADTNRPRTRQRRHKSPPPIDVPNIDEDAAERKRLLNVLAQRRYRQRKRQSRPATANDGGCEGSAGGTVDVELSQVSEQQETSDISPLDVPSSEAVDPLLSLDLGGALDPRWLAQTSMDASTSLTVASVPTSDPLSPGFLHGSNGDSATSFPDSYLLPMSDMTLVRAMLRVAGRINAHSVWELTANSPFHLGTSPPADQLPTTWQPTASQLLMPHHPIIDLLPWPTARDRILGILSLPDEARPPAARGDLAVVNFAYDIEDGAEGLRVWGADPYDETCWEVGQLAFAKWWFIFERSVIERSNYWRALRGAPPLRMEAPVDPRVSEL